MIGRYLADLERQLHVPTRERRRILGEARDHLTESVEHQVAAGADDDTAAREAVAAFGDAATVANRFGVEWQTRAIHRVPAVVGFAGAAVAIGFLLAALTQPAIGVSTSRETHASVAIPFNVGAVAFQIAFVAGALTLVRAASRWRLPEVGAGDRRLVARSGRVCAAGVVVTAVAWSAAIVDDARVHPDVRWSTIGLGLSVMVAAAVTGTAGMRRVGRIDRDEASAPGAPARSGIAGAGERLLGWEQRRPVIAVAAVAAAAGACAALHAETPLPGSLVWGALEAALVLGAYLALRDPLGLRAMR